MLIAREMLGTAIFLIAGAIAVAFGMLAYQDGQTYQLLGSIQRQRMWFAIGICCIATTLSVLAFVFRVQRPHYTPLARAAIGSLVVVLGSGVYIFLRSGPP